MTLRVQAMPKERLSWLAERSGCALTETLRGIEAIDATGRVHGAVGCDGWLGNAAQMHIAIDDPISLRALIGPSFRYLFNDCDKETAIAMVPGHNHRSLRFCAHLGFEFAYRLKDGFAPGDDMVCLIMRREKCRWLATERRAA